MGYGWGRGGRGQFGMWPGRGPFSYLPPWQRPGWLFGRGACWYLYGNPWLYSAYSPYSSNYPYSGFWPRYGMPYGFGYGLPFSPFLTPYSSPFFGYNPYAYPRW